MLNDPNPESPAQAEAYTLFVYVVTGVSALDSVANSLIREALRSCGMRWGVHSSNKDAYTRRVLQQAVANAQTQ